MNKGCSSPSKKDYEICPSEVQYSETDRIGSGGFGDVFKGTYKGGTVAVKEVRNETSSMNEINSLKRLNHPNIIEMHGHFTQGHVICIIMEFMESGSLADLLHFRTNLRYKADHVFSWSYQCADALQFLHSQPKKLIYRDLKPANLLLKNKYRYLKMSDFGTTVEQRSKMTKSAGTVYYMAPEVFKESKYDEKCDVYSFGIVLWEMITRQCLYEGDDEQRVMWSVVQNNLRPPPVANCSEALNDLMKRCWDTEPTQRPTMKEVLEIIREFKQKFSNGNDELTEQSDLKMALRTKHELLRHIQQLSEINRLKLKRDKLRTALEELNKIPDNHRNISENN